MPEGTLQNHYISSPHIFYWRWSSKWYFSFTFQHILSHALLNCCLVLAQRWLCAPCMQSANLSDILWDKRSFPTKFIAFNYWLFERLIKYDSKNLVMLGNLSKQSCESETAMFRAVTGCDKRALNIWGNDSPWRCEAKKSLGPGFPPVSFRKEEIWETPLCNCWGALGFI